MDGDAHHQPIVFTNAFSVSHSSLFIKDFSHLLSSTLVSAFQISFIIVGLVSVTCFLIVVHDYPVCILVVTRLPVPLDLFGTF